MDRLSINIGNQNNDGLGDKIRDAFIKVNNNFDTLFNINASGASQADVAAVSAALANEISGRHVASTALENHVNAVSAAINAVSVNTVSVANRVSAILNSNTTLGAPTYTFNSGTPSTAKTNGTIVVPGGVGVGGNIVANALYSDNYFFANGNPITTGGGGGGSVVSAPIYDLAYYQNGGTAVFGTPNLSYNGNSITLSSGNAATSTSTGALIITGGAGISGNLYIGGNLNLNGQDISAAVASINQEISAISNQVSVISQTISVMNVNIGNETSARIATSAALEAHINAVSAAMPNSFSDTVSAINNAISVVSAQVYSVNIALGTRIDTVSNAVSVVAAVANNATSIANAASAAAANATSIANAASNAVSVEIANRQSAVAAAESHINTVSNAVSIVSNAVSIVSVGVDRVSNAASVVSVGVDRVSNAVSNEIINRQSASAALESHVNTVSAAVNVVLNAVNNEISARLAVSATLETHVKTVSNAVSVVSAAYLSGWNAISNEISARAAASATLESHINTVSAVWTVSAANIYRSSGNVGINNSSPGSTLDVKGNLRLSGSTSGYVGLAPAATAGSTTYTLPSADGSSGQALTTNGSATLSWASVGSMSYDTIFGVGSDGDVTPTANTTTTLSKDMYYGNLTITGSTTKINTAGYRIFVRGTLDVSQYTGTGNIIYSPATYGAGGGGSGSTWTNNWNSNPSSLTTAGTSVAGTAGSSKNPGNGGGGNVGGVGGQSVIMSQNWGGPYYGTNTTAGGIKASTTNEKLGIINNPLLYGEKRNSLVSAGGAGGSGGSSGIADGYHYLDASENPHNAVYSGGTGGDGGGGGGALIIFANTFSVGSISATQLFQANGGNGSNGAAGQHYGPVTDDQIGGTKEGWTGAGGGGSGGGGGWVFLVYKTKTGNTITNMITANGGTGGNGGTGISYTSYTNGTGGKGGDSGSIYVWDLTNSTYTTTTGTSGSANSGQTGGSGGTCQATV